MDDSYLDTSNYTMKKKKTNASIRSIQSELFKLEKENEELSKPKPASFFSKFLRIRQKNYCDDLRWKMKQQHQQQLLNPMKPSTDHPESSVPTEEENKIKMMHRMGRDLGNKYSDLNKSRLMEKGSWMSPKQVLARETPSVTKGRMYGNQMDIVNRQKITASQNAMNKKMQMGSQNNSFYSPRSKPKVVEYGNYYTMRNNLKYMDKNYNPLAIKYGARFREEFKETLWECLCFEREHREVFGFLEERFNSMVSGQRGSSSTQHKKNFSELVWKIVADYAITAPRTNTSYESAHDAYKTVLSTFHEEHCDEVIETNSLASIEVQ